MTITIEQISYRGKSVPVPTVRIGSRAVCATGRWLRTAQIKDEEWMPGTVEDPDDFALQLRASGLGADLLTLPGPLRIDAATAADSASDNVAVIDTRDYQAWWNGLPQEARKNTRRAAKKGIEIRSASLDEAFVRGIKAIYDETPMRQGRAFWHYGKDMETIRRENASYLDRGDLIGAYHQGELVGFMKWVRVDKVARIMQILCMNAHQDKRPIIALINHAAQMCNAQGMHCLVYGKFSYGRKADSSITEFKRRLGFVRVDIERHYLPLTWRGRIALAMGLHIGWRDRLPEPVGTALRQWRTRWLDRSMRRSAPPNRDNAPIYTSPTAE